MCKLIFVLLMKYLAKCSEESDNVVAGGDYVGDYFRSNRGGRKTLPLGIKMLTIVCSEREVLAIILRYL